MTLTELISFIVENSMMDVYTSLPGAVTEFDSKTRTATIKLLPKLVQYIPPDFDDEDLIDIESELNKPDTLLKAEELPLLFNVPIHMPSCNLDKTRIFLPIKKNDVGMVIFTSRSIENYLHGDVAPFTVTDFRHHDINDAYFVPGILPHGAVKSVDNENNLLIEHDKLKISLSENGKISIKNDTVDLVEALYTIVDLLTKTTVNTLMGPQFLNTKVDLTTLLTKLNTIKN